MLMMQTVNEASTFLCVWNVHNNAFGISKDLKAHESLEKYMMSIKPLH